MTITVSISEFRNNISDYLAYVRAGDKIVLRDKKKNEDVAELVGKKKFDYKEYKAMLKRVAGTFTAKKHPEWRTRKDVEKWLRETRMNAERHFDAHS